MTSRLRHHPGQGQALAEFALVIPIFLLLLFALFDLGRAVFAYNAVTNAAREGARLAIVNQDASSNGAIATRIREQAFTASPTICIRFLKAGATLSDDCSELPPDDDLCPTTNSAGEDTGYTIGCIASIQVTESFSPVTPIISSIVGNLNLTAKTELPIEFTCPNPQIPAWTTASSCPKQP